MEVQSQEEHIHSQDSMHPSHRLGYGRRYACTIVRKKTAITSLFLLNTYMKTDSSSTIITLQGGVLDLIWVGHALFVERCIIFQPCSKSAGHVVRKKSAPCPSRLILCALCGHESTIFPSFQCEASTLLTWRFPVEGRSHKTKIKRSIRSLASEDQPFAPFENSQAQQPVASGDHVT